MSTRDPYHHLHDEDYTKPFDQNYVGANQLINMGGRKTISLNGEWNFVLDLHDEGLRQAWYKDNEDTIENWTIPRDYDDAIWQKTEVPSCWNVQKPEWFYFEGSGWYRRDFILNEKLDDKLYLLKIGAANYEARVFINNTYAGGHRGGSTPFFIDLSSYLHAGKNKILIQVENRRQSNRVPMNHTDWFNYGGLYRDVDLLILPKVHIKNFKIYLQEVSGQKYIHADVDISASASGEATLRINELDIVEKIKIVNGRGSVRIKASPELWEPNHPKLYATSISFETDEVNDKIGFRTVRIAGEKILLNGKDIFLRGICVHEDDLENGKTTTEQDIRQRFIHAKELGCNYIRLSHYPHHERAAEIADELGLLLWEEIPVYWAIAFSNQQTYDDAENQLCELILRDQNRASVIIWGVGNENEDTDQRLNFMSRLAQKAHSIDPTRLVSAACLINRQKFAIEDRLAEYLDVIGINEYFGWYEPSFDGLSQLLSNSSPGKPVVICETGADAKGGYTGDHKTLFSEMHQSHVLNKQFELLLKADFIRGVTPWILYDFRTERRQNSIQQGWNLKGLIRNDKSTKKQAFETVKKHYRELALKYEN